MVELGEISLRIAFVVSIYGTITAFWGGYGENHRMAKSAYNALFATFGLLTVASIVLFYAIVTHDYSVQYIYNYTSSDLNVLYLLSTFWAGQKGSLLMWGWMLAMFGTIVVLQNRVHNRRLLPYVVGILFANLVLFTTLMAFISPVFERLSGIPTEGYGLNPLLQNPGMIFHPPTLYIGYVGFTIPFAFAMAALMRRQLGDVWIRSTRRWTIFSWFFLGMGNLFGANWAYVELGWGGYWAWDPVENASFMPWLTGTAYLHSVMIQEKKDMLKTWNVSLIAITFCLTIFGTFITRSGLIASVHSFGESLVGEFFLWFLILSILFSIYFIATRQDILRSKYQLDSIVSRESSFMFNNLMLVGGAFAIFWGTIFPMISEAVRGVRITVGPPFFNKIMVPIGLALLIITGVCPLIAWRKATISNLKKNFLSPLFVTIAGSATLLVMGLRSIMPWIFFTVSIFVVTTIIFEVLRGVKARMAGGKENVFKGLFNLIWKNKRRYGGYTIHVGMVMMFVSFAGNAFNEKKDFTLKVGESAIMQDYTLTYYGTKFTRPKPTKEEIVATLLLEKNGKKLGYLLPEKNFYKNFNQSSAEVAILSTLKEDVYVIFASLNAGGAASFAVHINPLVKWLWMGGFFIAGGTILAMWPDAREKKRFEARYAA